MLGPRSVCLDQSQCVWTRPVCWDKVGVAVGDPVVLWLGTRRRVSGDDEDVLGVAAVERTCAGARADVAGRAVGRGGEWRREVVGG